MYVQNVHLFSNEDMVKPYGRCHNMSLIQLNRHHLTNRVNKINQRKARQLHRLLLVT